MRILRRRQSLPVRPQRDDRLAEIPGTLGRRLHRRVCVDGRDAARRTVARTLRLRLLQPRYQRLRGDRVTRCVQALGGVRTAVVAQSAAWQLVLPRAVAVRRGVGRRAAILYEAERSADALSVVAGSKDAYDRSSDDARDAARVSRRPRGRVDSTRSICSATICS